MNEFNLSNHLKLNNLKNVSIAALISIIKNKRKENKKTFEDNYKKIMLLIDQGNIEEADKISRMYVLGYYEYYVKAHNLEKHGEISKAAEIYWYNIISDGTDARAYFERLMIILRKLGDLETELIIAQLYKYFVPQGELDILNNRIETIKKKISH